MVRRSTFSNRAQLSVTQLEARDVPAGMIEVNMSGVLNISGDNENNHIRVEKPYLFQVVVSSDSGPIRYYDSLSGQFVITTDPVVFNDYADFFYNLSCDVQTGYTSSLRDILLSFVNAVLYFLRS